MPFLPQGAPHVLPPRWRLWLPAVLAGRRRGAGGPVPVRPGPHGRSSSPATTTDRLHVGRRLGATHVVNTSTNGDLAQVLGDLTDGRGPEAVIDAVSSAGSMRLSADSVQAGGTMSWVGMEVFLGAPELGWDQCFMRNLTIRGGIAPVKRYLPELWPLLERGIIDPSPVLTHDLGMDEAASGYGAMARRERGTVKVAVSPQS